MKKVPFETIIFDLGEVIIDLAYQDIVAEMQKLSKVPAQELLRLISQSAVLHDYETGQTDEEEFRQEMSDFLQADLGMPDLKRVWNSMLGTINPAKLDLMERLMEGHKVYVLSNTNAMHIDEVDRIIHEMKPGKKLADFAHTCYYSHEMHARKPNEDIYLQLIERSGLTPGKSIFFDDKPENVEAARKVGIHAEVVSHSDFVLEYFDWPK